MSLFMMPRGRIDIGWSDLAFAALSCAVPGTPEEADRRVRAAWGSTEDSMVCLSVRSGWDLFLRVMNFPEGSEILVTAVTIRDMVRIVEHHGLVPVPVDVDMETLTVKREALEQAVTPRTRAVIAAHLFGAVMPLDETADFAREHGLYLLEDCAQSFVGIHEKGHEGSDVTLYSFGPIKTTTAMAGAILRFKDPDLRQRMLEAQGRYPVQRRMKFFKRTLRLGLVRFLLNPLPFGIFYQICQLLGKNHDDVVNHSIRGFSGPAFFDNIRHRPSAPILSLLRRRLSRFDGRVIEVRRRSAARAIELMPDVSRPGRRAGRHSYWTFPVLADDPDALCRHLWSRGFDATRGKWSLYTVPSPEEGDHEPAHEAEGVMSRVVYVPVVHPKMTDQGLSRLATALAEYERAGPERRVEAQPV